MRFIYSIKDRCIYTQILNAFEFDLEHNGTIKTIRLTKEIDKIDAYAPCTFFGYKFEDNIDETLRKKAIDYLETSLDYKTFSKLARGSIWTLDSELNIFDFKTIVCLTTKSRFDYLFSVTAYHINAGYFVSDLLITELTKNIEFDYDGYTLFLRQHNVNENDITESCNAVKAMVGNLHNLPYFKVEESTKAYFKSAQNTKAKYGDFLNKFFRFKSQRQAEAFEAVQKDYLLLIADISASHFAIKSTLNNIRALNPKCEIIVFYVGASSKEVLPFP